jgi:hypothetical protein
MRSRPSGTARSTGVPSIVLHGRNAVPGPDHQLALDFDVADLDDASTLAAIGAGFRPSPSGLQRIGESDEFARLLLRLLEQNGWSILEPPPFAGGGVFLIATHDWREARGAGQTLGMAAAALLAEVSTFYGVRQLATA